MISSYIEQRVIEGAEIFISNKSTIRKVAKQLGVSKSTIHKDLVTRLPEINYGIYLKVKDILDVNTKERAIRGGLSTKQKYLKNN